MIAPVPARVVADELTWRARRAWPARDGKGYDLEVENPDVVGVRAATWSPEGGATVQLSPVDRALPALSAIAGEGEIVSWRRGRRAVVRCADGRSFAKVVRPRRLDGVLRAHADTSGFADGFDIAAVRSNAADRERGVVRLDTLPGRTLHDVGQDGGIADDEFRTAWETWAHGAVALLAHVPSEAATHDAAAEAGVVDTWARAAEPLLAPDLHSVLRRAAARIGARLVGGDDDRLAVAHRDLHDKQLLWNGTRRLGLLDLDTRATAEAALDLGNLRAHVRLRLDQGALTPARARIARAVIDEVTRTCVVDPDRVRLYEEATALRVSCLYLFRPAWHELALRRIEEHADQMSR